MKTKEERAVYDKNYYEKNKATVLARVRKYHEEHKEKIHEYQRKYWLENRGTTAKEISCESMRQRQKLIKETREKALKFAELWPRSKVR